MPGAGSLAVIFQPAFFHFFGELVISRVLCLLLCLLVQVPMCLKELPVDFGCHVENGPCRSRFELAACAFGSHLVLEVPQGELLRS